MALRLGELVAFIKGDNTALKRTLAESKTETRATGEDMTATAVRSAAASAVAWARSYATQITASRTARTNLTADIDEVRAKIRRLAEEYGRTRNQSLLGNLDTERAKLHALEQTLRDLTTAGSSTAAGFASFVSGVGTAASAVSGLIPILLIAGAAMLALGPGAVLIGGLLGAIPALVVGALGAVAVLGIGMIGLGDAFTDTAAAGGSVVDRARQIALAERSLADANREATDVQNGLNRARETAAERAQDLVRGLAGARLDERAAVDAVTDAQRRLTLAQLSENPERIERAQLAYEQAQQSLADVQDRVEDLAAEQQRAAAQGVEGSDEVQAALERQRRAVVAVSDAQYDLRKAQTETSGGAVKQATQISASAAAAVAMVKRLGSEYTALRLDIQQRLFAGVDEEILELSDAWMPTLRRRLGGMADMFNGLFKTWAETSRKPEFIKNITAGWESVEGLIDRVLSSVAGPGLEAFGTLAAAADPFIDKLGDGLGTIVDDFARWIDEADKDGSLTQFFSDATSFLSTAGSIGRDTMSAITTVIGGVRDFGREVHDLYGVELQGLKDSLGDVAGQISGATAESFGEFKKYVSENKEEIKQFISSASDFTRDTGPIFAFLIKSIAAQLMTSASAVMILVGALDRLYDWYKRNISWLSPFGALLAKVTGGSPTVSSATSGRLPGFADGAYVPARPGGTLAVVAEAGQAEWELPDDKLQAALDQAVQRGVAGGDGASAPPAFEAHIYIDGQELRGMVRVELREHNRSVTRRVRAGAETR